MNDQLSKAFDRLIAKFHGSYPNAETIASALMVLRNGVDAQIADLQFSIHGKELKQVSFDSILEKYNKAYLAWAMRGTCLPEEWAELEADYTNALHELKVLYDFYGR